MREYPSPELTVAMFVYGVRQASERIRRCPGSWASKRTAKASERRECGRMAMKHQLSSFPGRKLLSSGFPFPVALTAATCNHCVLTPREVKANTPVLIPRGLLGQVQTVSSMLFSCAERISIIRLSTPVGSTGTCIYCEYSEVLKSSAQ